MKLDWRGEQVRANVAEASAAAIDETTEAAARAAASVRSGRTGNMTSQPASRDGSGRLTGRWGLFPEPRGGDAWYELFLEAGGAYNPGDNAKRSAADREYPSLASRIQRRLGG